MKLLWEDRAWDDYLWRQSHGRKTLKRINSLINEIKRDPFSGPGKPEPLRHEFSGMWSRRIDECNRIVYFTKDDTVFIIACRSHYDD
ncbi:MAG: Txe/YoeB family addiction module toxin [Clostridia bacterium]|nr:Txe/YoeB family addiction module toxin [Clostridia bacterium]